MATYTKQEGENKNIYLMEDGELYIAQVLEIKNGKLHCDTTDATQSGTFASSSEEEYLEVNDEIKEWGRIGQRPANAPSG